MSWNEVTSAVTQLSGSASVPSGALGSSDSKAQRGLEGQEGQLALPPFPGPVAGFDPWALPAPNGKRQPELSRGNTSQKGWTNPSKYLLPVYRG